MKSSKLLSLVFLILAGTVAYFSYPIIKERYFANNQNTPNPSGDNSSTEGENGEKIEPLPPEEQKELEEIEKEESTQEETPSYENEEDSFLDVTSDDCLNRCEKHKSDAQNLRYCQEFCGISSTSSENTDNCSDKEGLEEYYCLKDKAIREKNFKICSQIEDQNIRESCKHRLTEDIFE